MNTREILVAARELLASPERWTKRTDARDKHGLPTDYAGDSAVCWCISGATGAAELPSHSGLRADHALQRVLGLNCLVELAAWNDAPERTHAEVLDAFDRAIAACDLNGPGGAGTELT